MDPLIFLVWDLLECLIYGHRVHCPTGFSQSFDFSFKGSLAILALKPQNWLRLAMGVLSVLRRIASNTQTCGASQLRPLKSRQWRGSLGVLFAVKLLVNLWYYIGTGKYLYSIQIPLVPGCFLYCYVLHDSKGIWNTTTRRLVKVTRTP